MKLLFLYLYSWYLIFFDGIEKLQYSGFIYYDKWENLIWINFAQNQKMSPKNMDSLKKKWDNVSMSSVASGSANVPASGIPSSSASGSSISNPPGNQSDALPCTSGMLTLANSFPNYFNAIYPHLSLGIPTSVPVVPLRFNTGNPTPPCKRIR